MVFITRPNASMTRNLGLDVIRAFVTVADTGNMTVAANLRQFLAGPAGFCG
jgi:hypothetical protein